MNQVASHASEFLFYFLIENASENVKARRSDRLIMKGNMHNLLDLKYIQSQPLSFIKRDYCSRGTGVQNGAQFRMW